MVEPIVLSFDSSLKHFIALSSENPKLTLLYTQIAISLTYCVLGFKTLSTILQAFFIHEAIPKINQLRFINALWLFVHCVLFISSTFWKLDDTTFKDAFFQASSAPQCTNTSVLKTQHDISYDSTLPVPLISFFLHQVYVSISIYAKADLISMGCLSIFVYASHSIRCFSLCTQFLYLVAHDVGSMELAIAFYALKSRFKGFRGPQAPWYLGEVALVLFILHVIMWTAVNLYLLPKLYMALPSVTEIQLATRSATAYINVFLVIYIKKRIFESPVWNLLKLVVTRPSDLKRIQEYRAIPAVVLLPYTSPLLSELRAIQMAILHRQSLKPAQRRKRVPLNGQSSAPVSDEKADLLSMIQCVKFLKRKMRNRYEQKSANDDCSEGRDQTHEPSDKNTNEPSPELSQNQEITDIFIPVPTADSSNANGSPSSLEIEADVHHTIDEEVTELNEDKVKEDTEENQEEDSETAVDTEQDEHI